MDVPTLPPRYSLLNAIGEGGEGRVYRVDDNLRGAELALKVAPLESSHWLRKEFETLREIHHENLIRVYDWGLTQANEVFYTMELILGGDWSRHMATPQTPDKVLKILASVLRGLAHLHCHGELHRDLKPGNVLLGEDGRIKIADVGMATAGGVATQTGTPGYSAPELWAGAKAGVRSDIYSVGVMAYEALTGIHPFTGKTIRDVISGQLEGWVPSPAAHGVKLPADLERAVMRALERDPTLRPGSADELLELLGCPDRVGHIPGGRFVGRSEQIAVVVTLLGSVDPSAPPMVWIGGETGVGKTALIEEVVRRATNLGRRVVHVVSMDNIGQFKSTSAPTFSESAQIWALAQAQPTVFILNVAEDDLGATVKGVRTLARHLSVIAKEEGQTPGVLFICESHDRIPATEHFEMVMEVPPLAEVDIMPFIKGYLGAVDLQPEIVRWLGSISGGLPSRLSSITSELVDRNHLRRNAGRWQFNADQTLASIEGSLQGVRSHQAWDELDLAEQALVGLLAIMPQGIGRRAIELAIDGSTSRIDGLIAKGWLRRAGARLQLASGEARRVALGSAAMPSVAEAALLDSGPEHLTREEMAWLLVRNSTSRNALKEGLWAARVARDRGDLRATVERANACLRIAAVLKDEDGAAEAEIILAHALHLLGHDDQAVQHLVRKTSLRSAGGEQLLGIIRRTQGRLDESRAHLEHAIRMAEVSGDEGVFLRSHAELAEVDWRHGDEKARDSAINRVKAALETDAARRGEVNDRAALVYQLGSALVFAGNRDEARTVLASGLALNPDSYWTMRLTTGLAAAEYYLGEFDSALTRMEEAWRHAERGGFDLYKSRIYLNKAAIHYGLGRFREAVDGHRLSAIWARRSGQEFEYLAACSNEAVNLMFLGEYESALSRAGEAEQVAARIGNGFQLMKNLETQALCQIYIGDYAKAQAIAEAMLVKSNQFGYSDMTPRVLLLKGVLSCVEERWEEARAQLLEAETMLLRSRDWEDLPGVQIELQFIRGHEDPQSAAETLAGIVREAARKRAVSIQLRGGFVLGEILLAGQVDSKQYWDTLLSALGRAGEAGAVEDEWRLHYVLGELCLRNGDRKAAASRFGQALRGYRSIAERLSADHRRCYLGTPHAKRLLTRTSS